MRAIFIFLSLVSVAFAETPLPYSSRTRPYSGSLTTVRGDIRTVGMAGATIGLGDTFIAATDNPAGLAMTMGTGDFNFTSNWVNDNRMQDYQSGVTTTNFGAALNIYPWGVSLGYVAPYAESQPYTLSGVPPGTPSTVQLSSKTRELRFSLARVFFKNKFSLGATLNNGQAETEYLPAGSTGTAFHSYAWGATLGGMLQLENRVLLGISYSLPLHYAGDVAATQPGISGFFQPIEVPGKLGVGLGWIPNRFFRTDLSVFAIGNTDNTALLRNDNEIVGKSITLQPRLGAAYVAADYSEFSATAFLGTYFEMTRVEGANNRVHVTGGLETKPWIFTLGWGLDLSPGYNNTLVTLGVDVFKVMAKLKLIPKVPRPAPAGLRPSPWGLSDDGLSRPLVKNWRPQGPPIDPIKIGLELPNKIGNKVIEMGGQIRDFTEGLVGIEPEVAPSPSPKALPKKGKKKPPQSPPPSDSSNSE